MAEADTIDGLSSKHRMPSIQNDLVHSIPPGHPLSLTRCSSKMPLGAQGMRSFEMGTKSAGSLCTITSPTGILSEAVEFSRILLLPSSLLDS